MSAILNIRDLLVEAQENYGPDADGTELAGQVLMALVQVGGRLEDSSGHPFRHAFLAMTPVQIAEDPIGVAHTARVVALICASLQRGKKRPDLGLGESQLLAKVLSENQTWAGARAALETARAQEGQARAQSQAQAHTDRLAKLARRPAVPPSKPVTPKNTNAENVRRFALDRRPPPLPDEELGLDDPNLKGVA